MANKGGKRPGLNVMSNFKGYSFKLNGSIFCDVITETTIIEFRKILKITALLLPKLLGLGSFKGTTNETFDILIRIIKNTENSAQKPKMMISVGNLLFSTLQ